MTGNDGRNGLNGRGAYRQTSGRRARRADNLLYGFGLALEAALAERARREGEKAEKDNAAREGAKARRGED